MSCKRLYEHSMKKPHHIYLRTYPQLSLQAQYMMAVTTHPSFMIVKVSLKKLTTAGEFLSSLDLDRRVTNFVIWESISSSGSI